MYMCVVLVYFLTLRIDLHFWKKIVEGLLDVSTKRHVIMAERAQTKSGNGAIGYRRKLPSVEITLPRDIILDFQLISNPDCVFYTSFTAKMGPKPNKTMLRSIISQTNWGKLISNSLVSWSDSLSENIYPNVKTLVLKINFKYNL